jgi:hypothetical protein
MIQKELNEENKEIKSKAYELYEKHGLRTAMILLIGLKRKGKREHDPG